MGGMSAGFDGYQRIVSAVKYERNGKPLEHLDTRAVCQDRGKLASDSHGIVRPIEGGADLGSQLLVRRRIARATDRFIDFDAVLNRKLAVAAIRTGLHYRSSLRVSPVADRGRHSTT